MDNLGIREEILDFHLSRKTEIVREKSKTPNPNMNIKIEDKKEINNITNNPALKNNTEDGANSTIDIESDLK